MVMLKYVSVQYDLVVFFAKSGPTLGLSKFCDAFTPLIHPH